VVILDNYIIRIYRRDKSNPLFIVGTVEEVGSRGKKGFTTFDELREILVPPPGGRYARMKTLKNKRESMRKGI
jgi:hypothetical protein